MGSLAILIGIYSYLIFALGVLGYLYKGCLLVTTFLFLFFSFWFIRSSFKKELAVFLKDIEKDKISKVFLSLILIQALVNLVGTLGPELGFDALWYHLTLPKIYLANHRLLYIPGNLLYYSPMPKLVEMIYTASLAIGSEILAKLVHFLFGVLSAIALFKLSRRYLAIRISLAITTIFYTCLVVGWQSITAYVDLGRTFFEILAFDYFLRWWGKGKPSYLIESAVMLGLGIATKLLALGSLVIYLFLIFIKFLGRNLKKVITLSAGYSIFSLLIPAPWFVASFLHTGNPVFPVLSRILSSSHQLTAFNLVRFIKDFWNLFLYSVDPISPVFLILLPLIVFYYKKIGNIGRVVFVYCILGYLIWYFIPRVGGGRFILPYLPGFSLLSGFLLDSIKSAPIKKLAIKFIIVISLINISYRFAANSRYLPVLEGLKTKGEFLSQNLNFQFGDFYDVDGFFNRNIESDDLVLVEGIHNLFYVNFPFVHESWAKPGTPVTHILVRGELPERYGQRRLLYSNDITKVKLYLYGERLR